MKWIKCSEKKPPVFTNLLFCLRKGDKVEVISGWDERDDDECDVCFCPEMRDPMFDWEEYEPTHWCAYPDPVKE